MFSQAVIEKLGYYVYFLEDSTNNEVFYVGKGNSNRVFDHLNCALETDHEGTKLERIRKIDDSGNKVRHFILRHGLTESAAFELEAALIDFIGKNSLLNLQGGHYSGDYGLKTTDEISAMYESEDLSTNEPIILININKLYHREMTEEELYDATRKSWVIGSRRNNAKYAVATYRGLTREVYKIDKWSSIQVADNKIRWGFEGSVADPDIRKKLRYKSITPYFVKGAANPIKYINC